MPVSNTLLAVEYEYRDPKTPRGHSDNPPSATSLSTIQESSNSQEAYAPDNYTYNVENVTEDFAGTNLGGEGETLHQTTSGGQGRPQSAGIISNYPSRQ